MAQKYRIVANGLMCLANYDILELQPVSDWRAEDIEAIAKLAVGERYQGDWPEDFQVVRVA